MTLALCAGLLPAVLFQLPGAAPQQPPLPAILDLRPLQWHAAAVAPPPFYSLLDRDAPRVSLLADDSLEPGLSGDDVGSLLHMLHGAALEAEHSSLRIDGDTALLQADAKDLPALLRDLQQLQRIVTQPIELRAALYELGDAEDPPPVLDAAALAATLAQRRPLWSATQRARSGGRVEFGRERWNSYIGGVEVEVACKIASARPVVRQYFTGVRLSVVPHLLSAGDDVVLHCQFAVGQAREVRRQPTGFADQASLDIPVLEQSAGACSGRVDAGGALAIRFGGAAAGGGRFLLTLSARRLGPRQDPHLGDAVVLPVGALVSMALQQPGDEPCFDVHLEREEVDHTPRFGTGGLDADALQGMLADNDAFAADSAFLQMHGHCWLFARDDAAGLERLTDMLRALEDRLLQNAGVAVDVTLGEAMGAGAFAPSTQDSSARTLHAVSLPTLLGRTVSCCRGIETRIAKELAIEVADSIQIQHPYTVSQTEGLYLQAVVSPSESDPQVDLRTTLCLQSLELPRQIESGGLLSLPRPELARLQCIGAWTAGQPLALGEGPRGSFDGRSYRSELSARITRIP